MMNNMCKNHKLLITDLISSNWVFAEGTRVKLTCNTFSLTTRHILTLCQIHHILMHIVPLKHIFFMCRVLPCFQLFACLCQIKAHLEMIL